jgi:2-oxoglutarate dehydrogenase E1 component
MSSSGKRSANGGREAPPPLVGSAAFYGEDSSHMQESDEASPESGAAEEASDLLETFGVNAGIVAEIRQRYEIDPGSVHESWADLFDPDRERDEGPLPAEAPGAAVSLASPRVAEKHARVLRMIHAYRARGHRIADTDPLGTRVEYFPELDPAHYGLGKEDAEELFFAGDLPGGPIQPLAQIVARLRATYCRRVGVEFTHIQDPGRRQWLMRRMEESENSTPLATPEKLRVLEKVCAAELFERFIHTKFVGQKRFSLEGAEALIPLLDTIVEDAPGHNVRELVIGMAHRGRLNVLSNIVGKSLASIFTEFEDIEEAEAPFGSGDVKYHKGYSSDRVTRAGGQVHLSLTANPSHLEAVDPVVEGRAKAKQVRSGDVRGRQIAPVLIHGDAAFAGQGMVAETLNLSHLNGYSTGGTLHIVVNNQIGFTTTPQEARSTLYCTDVAKMIQVPIFHVNGDDPDAVVHCVRLAFAYRQRFEEDIVIDLVCYRRHGHNEGDEPSFTQPLLYEKIRALPGLRALYIDQLVKAGVLNREDVAHIEADLSKQLLHALDLIKTRPPTADDEYEVRGPWVGIERTRPTEPALTAVPAARLTRIAEGIAATPSGFQVHKKLQPLLDRRRKVVADGGPIDWALAEALAFGSLVTEGTPVRLSGQDCSRGTFSQRHAVVVDQTTGQEYAPLDHIAETQARFEVYDSHLSEAAVLGFEYGYAFADPTTLTLWEAQFGDFANGAQVIIDQFIASAHAKWGRMSGLVMLLPHGYEGQGPEHSSARIERYLQLCAEDNLQVVNCTTPAQYFHVLRRQMRRNWRAPLVIFTPKSLLRAPRAVSRVDELAGGVFQVVIDDAAVRDGAGVQRVLLCSGKVYYDLMARREERDRLGEGAARGDVAIVRVEELYPWPDAELAALFGRFASAKRVVWVQEEPANMGAWTFVRERLQDLIPARATLAYAGRPASASTAVGSGRVHRIELNAFLTAAFGE